MGRNHGLFLSKFIFPNKPVKSCYLSWQNNLWQRTFYCQKEQTWRDGSCRLQPQVCTRSPLDNSWLAEVRLSHLSPCSGKLHCGSPIFLYLSNALHVASLLLKAAATDNSISSCFKIAIGEETQHGYFKRWWLTRKDHNVFIVTCISRGWTF